MPHQPSLFGSAADASALVHRLFFAILPDAAARLAISDRADMLRAQQAVRGRWIDPSRYHMTLHFLGDHSGLRQDLVDRASSAAARIATASFDLELDRLASFTGRKPTGVLCCTDESNPVHALWQALRRELSLVGLGARLESKFVPHVTLFYGDGPPLEPANIAPVAWRVRDFALVHSVVGQGGYRILANWPLSG